jgi:hypothetical protein
VIQFCVSTIDCFPLQKMRANFFGMIIFVARMQQTHVCYRAAHTSSRIICDKKISRAFSKVPQ